MKKRERTVELQGRVKVGGLCRGKGWPFRGA